MPWTLVHQGITWNCRTEQDALGVLCFLRDFGRRPMGKITIEPAPSKAISDLLSTLPNQGGSDGTSE